MLKFPGLDSVHKLGEWKGRFERVLRWNERVQRNLPLVRDRVFTVEDLDDLFAFFMNCYHLRDWLNNSKVMVQTKVDEFFRDSPEMQVCQDICNGLKHYDLSRPKVDSKFMIGRQFEYTAGLLNKPFGGVGLFVIAGHDKYNLYELAEKCTRLWNESLEKNGLV